MTLAPIIDKQIYSVLFSGLLTNMFDPATLCPGRFPLAILLSKKSVPLTLHAAVSVTSHVSSIGNGVRPGRYVILL